MLANKHSWCKSLPYIIFYWHLLKRVLADLHCYMGNWKCQIRCFRVIKMAMRHLFFGIHIEMWYIKYIEMQYAEACVDCQVDGTLAFLSSKIYLYDKLQLLWNPVMKWLLSRGKFHFQETFSWQSHLCDLSASERSSDLTVPGMWPLCYSWIGYRQANGSAESPAI